MIPKMINLKLVPGTTECGRRLTAAASALPACSALLALAQS